MISVGNDIEEVSRFKRLLEIKPQLLQKIFSQYEWDYSINKNQAQTLAGIWCAKEAVVKAICNYAIVDVRDVQIRHRSNGAPFVFLILNYEIIQELDFSVSISHTKIFASAVCMVQKKLHS